MKYRVRIITAVVSVLPGTRYTLRSISRGCELQTHQKIHRPIQQTNNPLLLHCTHTSSVALIPSTWKFCQNGSECSPKPQGGWYLYWVIQNTSYSSTNVNTNNLNYQLSVLNGSLKHGNREENNKHILEAQDPGPPSSRSQALSGQKKTLHVPTSHRQRVREVAPNSTKNKKQSHLTISTAASRLPWFVLFSRWQRTAAGKKYNIGQLTNSPPTPPPCRRPAASSGLRWTEI